MGTEGVEPSHIDGLSTVLPLNYVPMCRLNLGVKTGISLVLEAFTTSHLCVAFIRSPPLFLVLAAPFNVLYITM